MLEQITPLIITYNEAANVGNVVGRVLTVDAGYHVLVVDDNSPDGTADIVAGLALTDCRVHLLRRSSDGSHRCAARSPAVVLIFRSSCRELEGAQQMRRERPNVGVFHERR